MTSATDQTSLIDTRIKLAGNDHVIRHLICGKSTEAAKVTTNLILGVVRWDYENYTIKR